jgi:hypothetical protein
MLQRDDLLRLARIIDYDRFVTPSLGMFSEPGFEFEYVQFSVRKLLDTGGYCIIHQTWKKAKKGTAFDPCFDTKEIQRKMQENEIRTRKEMKTSELRKMLETLPLEFKFEDGIRVVVLPKSTEFPHEVYVKWSKDRNLFVEQRSLNWTSDLHQQWFNSKRATSEVGEDWRYLLKLNYPDNSPRDVLYKYFEGVYTDDIDFRLIKGTELYRKEFYIETKKSGKRIKKKRIYKYTLDPERKEKFKKRKEMSKGNREAQMLLYNPEPRRERRGSKVRYQPNSPYQRFQTITIEQVDEKNPELRAQETIKVKRLKPEYEYIPIVWNVYEYTTTKYQKTVWDKRRGTCQVRTVTERIKGKLLETIPFLNEHGKPLLRRKFVKNVEVWDTITRDVPIIRKTIKVLQIPSKKMSDLKKIMSDNPLKKREDAIPLVKIVRDYSTRLGPSKKSDEPLWRKLYSEYKVERKYEDYWTLKKDGHGTVHDTLRRKLVS